MWSRLGGVLAVAGVCAGIALVVAAGSAGERVARAARPPAPDRISFVGRYLTIVFGRSMIAQSDRLCRMLPGAVPLDRIAIELARRGLRATGNVTVAEVGARRPHCADGVRYADWRYLARLRDAYGWSFQSRGMTSREPGAVGPGQRAAETCGSLRQMYAHGHRDAWAMYASPNGAPPDDAASLRRCFAFVRAYGDAANAYPVRAPFRVVSKSVNGGRCNVRTLPCWSMAVRGGRRYQAPHRLAAIANGDAGAPGRWTVLQWYRIVDGAYGIPAGRPAWDCTARDWRRHWTTLAETYCLADLLRVLDALDADVVVTDPATLARAQGRDLGPPAPVRGVATGVPGRG